MVFSPSSRERLAQIPIKDPTERRVRAFEQRYGLRATQLAAHAAFPLTLTTDVVYCLRETFLPECPWYSAADVLLSGLCEPAGHDLYEMAAATRRYLLRYLRDQFGEGRLEQLERFMVAYLRHRLVGEVPDDRALLLGEKPHWTVLACLQPGQAYEEIRQTLMQLAQQSPEDEERFRLAGLVESYGDLLADRGYRPVLLNWADRLAEGEPIDEMAEAAERLAAAGFDVRWVEFEVATVAFGAEAAAIAREGSLVAFAFETVRVDDRGEVVARAARKAAYFEEALGEGVASLKLVGIPSGEFMMGSPEDETGRLSSESPQHLVKVSPFFMGQYPVTQAQWRAVAALPQEKRTIESAPSRFKGDERPVERVSWEESVEFCARLSAHTGRTYRLPTEAEWEYACRADTTTPFYFGETLTTELANYNGSVFLNEPKGKRRGETVAVGSFLPNAFGLYDMHGNVWEWCQDHWHDSYAGAPTDGSAWLVRDDSEKTPLRGASRRSFTYEAGGNSRLRVLRGGSWDDYPRNCRSACRCIVSPDDRDYYNGFRVVCEARGL